MAGGTWYLPDPSGGEGSLVFNAHPEDACAGRGCPLHEPSDHWARDMPLRWKRDSRGSGVMLRLCPHGVWHDDPDDLDYRTTRGIMPSYRHMSKGCNCPCVCDTDPPF